MLFGEISLPRWVAPLLGGFDLVKASHAKAGPECPSLKDLAGEASLAILFGNCHGDVGVPLMVDQLPASVITVHGKSALGFGNPPF